VKIAKGFVGASFLLLSSREGTESLLFCKVPFDREWRINIWKEKKATSSSCSVSSSSMCF
jgi:hypothetical protein